MVRTGLSTTTKSEGQLWDGKVIKFLEGFDKDYKRTWSCLGSAPACKALETGSTKPKAVHVAAARNRFP